MADKTIRAKFILLLKKAQEIFGITDLYPHIRIEKDELILNVFYRGRAWHIVLKDINFNNEIEGHLRKAKEESDYYLDKEYGYRN